MEWNSDDNNHNHNHCNNNNNFNHNIIDNITTITQYAHNHTYTIQLKRYTSKSTLFQLSIFHFLLFFRTQNWMFYTYLQMWPVGRRNVWPKFGLHWVVLVNGLTSILLLRNLILEKYVHVVCCGVYVWSGVVWCGVVWCGVVWCGVV